MPQSVSGSRKIPFSLALPAVRTCLIEPFEHLVLYLGARRLAAVFFALIMYQVAEDHPWLTFITVNLIGFAAPILIRQHRENCRGTTMP